MQVSSDLNTSNHNYPTNYNNTIFVAGSVADTHGVGYDDPNLAAVLQPFGVGMNAVSTWFRNSNLTQFGGHAHVVMMGDTGSQATGQASGAAGLVASRGLELAGQIGGRLRSNEIKQILTMSAEDVLPENTLGMGLPDPSQPGWDQHFGYGRVDLAAAVRRVAPGKIPPEAGIESPAWFAPLDPVTTPFVPISGYVGASRATSYVYQLEWAPGLEPLDAAFVPFGSGGSVVKHEGQLGVLPLSAVAALLPGAAQGLPPLDPYQYAFTVRLRVIDNLGNRGEDRRTLFAFHDPTLHEGWPKFVDSGGESSMRIADVNGDGVQEIISANSSGELSVWNGNGTRSQYFNHGKPFLAPVPSNISRHLKARALASGAVDPGRGGFTTPAIDDLTGDGLPEIVVANGDRVYALRGNGKMLPGFPVALNPLFSAPSVRTRTNHVKTGIFSSPVLADLNEDGKLDIIVSAMDQRAYAWTGKGKLLPGWPVLLQDPDAATPAGAESINTPAIADIDGDGHLDVIVPTNEFYQAGSPAPNPEDFAAALRKGVLDLAAGLGGLVSSRVYVIRHNGTLADGDTSDNSGFVIDRDAFLSGWPVALNGVADILPLVGPGLDPVVVDVDGGPPEVIVGSTLGDMIVLGGDGVARHSLANGGAGPGLSPSVVFNLFEYAAVGDTTGLGRPSIFKGGLPAAGLVNLVAVGQNLPFNHVVQGWDAGTGLALPGWPRATDDWQLLSSPSIANVGGGGEREVIVGTGLYLLHAYQPNGLEPPGFPKFAGGWLSGVTPVGDIDGDGLLEIANWTREGNIFVWDTDVSVCDGDGEWPGFRHDDRNTGVYGHDARSPGPVRDLQASAPLLGGSPTLTWEAPGSDGPCGRASHYEVRALSEPLTEDTWESALLLGTPAAGQAGSAEAYALPAVMPGTMYLGVRAIDQAGNAGPISEVVSP
jgi:hypothetical protein